MKQKIADSISPREKLSETQDKKTKIKDVLSNFILGKEIGRGSFGKVCIIKEKSTNIQYAAKISLESVDEESSHLLEDISREINIISKLNHPSVLEFILCSPHNFKKKNKPVIITEYASRGSLNTFLELLHDQISKENLNDTQKLNIIYGIASGMEYLHSHGILHRDLKPGNILLDDFLFPKIADFGLSKVDRQELSDLKNIVNLRTTVGKIKGTPKYISPEIWSNAEYSKAGDVYAFAIIVYEIMT